MKKNRPLSPHLSIYKKILTSVFSIFHRFTGIGLSFGSVGICIWIAFIALGESYYSVVQKIFSSNLFIIILFVWTIGIFYHLFNGIRYLFWSVGYGLELKTVYNTGYLVILLTFVSTFVVWLLI